MNYDEKQILSDLLSETVIPGEKLSVIENFVDFLLLKNQDLNLISRKLDIPTILKEHIYDCVAGFQYFTSYTTIADLGTGGGFPGILLSIAFPDKTVHLIEKSPKKTVYLQEAVIHLDLKHTHVHNCLVPEFNNPVEVFTCRGFKPINEILTMTEKYYQDNSRYLLFKGKMETIEEEIQEARKKYSFHYDIFKIAAKIKEKERHMVIISRI